jgi:UDP-2-acetamido-2-deoxy-ribo-hexuluronate aminotransferase
MEFVDLKEQYRRYKNEIDAAIREVIESARFIGGPVIKAMEEELAAYVGVKHAVGCASGTDALLLGLLAKGVSAGDEVIVPDFTFIATAEVVSFLGAKPVFVDVEDDTLNIDPEKTASAVTEKTRGIIPVSLYGQCADFDRIETVAKKHGLWVMEDGAQSFGATFHGRKSCTVTELATTSFFPAKPLGCYGDGGAVFTNDDELAAKMRLILNHGQEKRYRHSIVGINARLDAIQAAVIRVKLRHLDDEIEARRRVAGSYTDRLKEFVRTPEIREYNETVWAQYTVRSAARDALVESLNAQGIPTAIHYPMPLHQQEAFSGLASTSGRYEVSDVACNEVFSLPMHPFLADKDIELICDVISAAKVKA